MARPKNSNPTCTMCGVLLTTENQTANRRRLGWHVCKTCEREYQRDWRHKNRDKVSAWGRASTKKLREECFAAYGGHCVCCGESETRFLQIDHIRGDGAEHRRELKLSGFVFYRWLRKHGYPKDNFQLLCGNCNQAKGYFGVCPHIELPLVELVKSSKKLEFSATGTPVMVGA